MNFICDHSCLFVVLLHRYGRGFISEGGFLEFNHFVRFVFFVVESAPCGF